ncbi:MAG: hypothetical protein LBB58_07250 [Cellulomonadaceae bacterium]|jgi:CRISPR/Cas system endoribonuclease Cas6 (RAMP superfamily)|nr:hypothetical protein [Cellulomonadaceae bacterium]
MQNIAPEYASELHSTAINPYSQYVIPGAQSDMIRWVVSGVATESTEGIFAALSEMYSAGFRLEQRGIDVKGIRETAESIPIKHLDSSFFSSDPPTRFRVKFLTQTAFRHQGEYTILPEPRLVFQSLAMKHAWLLDGEKLDEGLSAELGKSIRLGYPPLYKGLTVTRLLAGNPRGAGGISNAAIQAPGLQIGR